MSKSRGLQDLTGSDVTPLHIDNVPDLGDIKVAWDHVHVEGFLGSRLTLQTTWSAYDSMLAARARPGAPARARGRGRVRGPRPGARVLLQGPLGQRRANDFAAQTVALSDWVREATARVGGDATAATDRS